MPTDKGRQVVKQSETIVEYLDIRCMRDFQKRKFFSLLIIWNELGSIDIIQLNDVL